jgi:hypothetical protein
VVAAVVVVDGGDDRWSLVIVAVSMLGWLSNLSGCKGGNQAMPPKVWCNNLEHMLSLTYIAVGT